jgi:hypothetical protein
MNFHKARERHDAEGKPTGVWDYTCYNDNQKATWPEGYCHKWRPLQDTNIGREWTEHEIMEHARHKEKYHEVGHRTALDAVNCHREYELDRLRFWGEDRLTHKPDSLHRCKAEGCEKYCASFADIPGSQTWTLCEDHLNRETVEKLFPPYTDGEAESFGSY